MPLDLDALERLGYFVHVKPADRARVKAEMAASEYPVSVSVRRAYFADAENLDERGVLEFLGEVAPYLRHAGVPIEVDYAHTKQKADPERGLPLRVGPPMMDADGWIDPPDQTCRVSCMGVVLVPGGPMLDVRETQDEEGDDSYLLMIGDREVVIHRYGETDMSWYRATRVVISLVEELLAAHGSNDRVYVESYGGNDQRFYFLTPAMAAVINAGTRGRPLLASSELDANESRGEA